MIKGRQVQRTKKGQVLLVLHREPLSQPDDVNVLAWTIWSKNIPRMYRIEKPPSWWITVWPKIKARVNIALAKEQDDVALPDSRIWIRIAEDISIGVYSADTTYHKSGFVDGPFHPGCLTDHIRVPIDWWNSRVDDLTEEILRVAKDAQ